MQIWDPTAETKLSFEDAVWEGTKNTIITGGKSPEEAVEILKAGWRAQHERDIEAWNEHVQQCQREAENEREREQEQADPIVDEQPTESEAPEWVNLPTLSFLNIKSAQHVLK